MATRVIHTSANTASHAREQLQDSALGKYHGREFANQETFESINPTTGAASGRFVESSTKDVDVAQRQPMRRSKVPGGRRRRQGADGCPREWVIGGPAASPRVVIATNRGCVGLRSPV
jgi:hypothetical protein